MPNPRAPPKSPENPPIKFDVVLRDSERAVGLSMFFMLNEFGIMVEFGLGVDLRWIWEFDNIFCL